MNETFFKYLENEFQIQERMDKNFGLSARLVSAQIALDSGVKPEMVCKLYKLSLRDLDQFN